MLGLDPSRRRLVELGGGLLGGAALIGVIALLVAAVLPFPWSATRLPCRRRSVSLAYLLSTNAVEELSLRGYGFERWIAAIGHWPAQILDGAPIRHVPTSCKAGHGKVALVDERSASVLFGLVFVRWRSVPAALGVHAAMNWCRDLLLLDSPDAEAGSAPRSREGVDPGEQFTSDGRP